MSHSYALFFYYLSKFHGLRLILTPCKQTVQVDKYTFPGSSKLNTFSRSTILDSGTTLNYIPTDAAAAYNAAFSPPAVNSDEFGGYVVECDAKVPEFKVTIGGKQFSIDGRDQLLDLATKNKKGKELCYSGTQDGGALTGGNIFILYVFSFPRLSQPRSNELNIVALCSQW